MTTPQEADFCRPLLLLLSYHSIRPSRIRPTRGVPFQTHIIFHPPSNFHLLFSPFILPPANHPISPYLHAPTIHPTFSILKPLPPSSFPILKRPPLSLPRVIHLRGYPLSEILLRHPGCAGETIIPSPARATPSRSTSEAHWLRR